MKVHSKYERYLFIPSRMQESKTKSGGVEVARNLNVKLTVRVQGEAGRGKHGI